MSTMQLLAWLAATCTGASIGTLIALPILGKLNAWQLKKFEAEMWEKYKS